MVTRTTALAFFLGIPLLGVFLFGQIGRSTWAPHFAVILFTTSMFPHRTAWQYSDVPLAYFLLAAVGFLASTLHSDISRRLPLPLAGFFVGCLTWTKNEGSALAGMLVFAYGLVRWTSPEFRKATLRSLSLITLGAVSPVAALVTFRLAWSPESNFVQDIEANFIDHALSPARWIGSAVGYWETLTDWERWGLTWPILAVCWLVGLTTSRWFRAPLLRFGVLSAAGCSIGWYMIYVFTPLDQQWHIMTSLDRLALQLLPMLTFWGLVIFGTVNAKMEGLDDLLTPSLSPV
jgi:hypothetical protein